MERRTTYVTFNNSPKILPIDPTTDDPFYRYKMRQLIVQVIGKGKMIRTAFLNIDDVAKDLKVPAEYITAFFGHTIGAQAKYDSKKPERERGSLSGEYSDQELTEVFESFIRDFVLCYKCGLPEYSFNPAKKKVIVKCRSCGGKRDIDNLNLNPKFQKYVKNHPPPKTEDMQKEDREEQEEKRKQAAEEVAAEQATVQEEHDALGDQLMEDAKKLSISDESPADDWAFDTSADAVAARAAQMVPDKLKDLVSAESKSSPPDELAEIVKNAEDNKEIIKGVRRIAESQGMSKKEQTRMVYAVLLSENFAKMLTSVKKYRSVLAATTKAPEQQLELMKTMEAHFAAPDAVSEGDKATFLKQLPRTLKYLYDADIVDEEVTLKWARLKSKSGAKPMRAAAKPFCEWLQNAEEESDDE